MKNSFVLYTDYLEHIQDMDLEQLGTLFLAIFHYQRGEDLPEMDAETNMAFKFIRFQLDKDNKKYEETTEKRKEAGKLGGRPKANGFDEKAKKANGFFENQMKAKKPDNDNVNDNDLKEISPKGDKEKNTKNHFVPPTVEEVAAYCLEKGYAVDAEKFVDYYTSIGWVVNNTKIKDWKSRVRNWNRSQRQELTTKGSNKFNQFQQNGYDFSSLEKELMAN